MDFSPDYILTRYLLTEYRTYASMARSMGEVRPRPLCLAYAAPRDRYVLRKK